MYVQSPHDSSPEQWPDVHAPPGGVQRAGHNPLAGPLVVLELSAQKPVVGPSGVEHQPHALCCRQLSQSANDEHGGHADGLENGRNQPP